MPDFEEVYRLYFADVYKYVLALSRDTAVAEEITQETFFRALSTIGTFRGDCQLRVWLCQIARNLYTDLCRERRRAEENVVRFGGELHPALQRGDTAPDQDQPRENPTESLEMQLFVGNVIQ